MLAIKDLEYYEYVDSLDILARWKKQRKKIYSYTF